MMVLFLFSVDRHDGAFGRSYTGKTFLSRQLSYTRSLSLLGAVKRRTTQMVANGRFPHRFFLWLLKELVFGESIAGRSVCL